MLYRVGPPVVAVYGIENEVAVSQTAAMVPNVIVGFVQVLVVTVIKPAVPEVKKTLLLLDAAELVLPNELPDLQYQVYQV